MSRRSNAFGYFQPPLIFKKKCSSAVADNFCPAHGSNLYALYIIIAVKPSIQVLTVNLRKYSQPKTLPDIL